jgi:hypothetical protein
MEFNGITFPISRLPLPFPEGWTTTGTAPNRKLIDPDGRVRVYEQPSGVAPYSETAALDAAVAVLQESGGGSQSAHVIGPFTLVFDTPGLTDTVQDGTGGALVWQPNIGDWIIDVWLRVITVFNQPQGHNELILNRQILDSDEGYFDYTEGQLFSQSSSGSDLGDAANIPSVDLPWYRVTTQDPDDPTVLVASRGWAQRQNVFNADWGNPVPFLVTGELEIRAWIPLNPGNDEPSAGEVEVYALVQEAAT